MSEDTDDRKWHLDKRVPLAMIFAIVVQTVGVVIWAAKADTRLDQLESRANTSIPHLERIVRLETKMDGIYEALADIRQLLRGKP